MNSGISRFKKRCANLKYQVLHKTAAGQIIMGDADLCKCDDCIYIDAMVRRGMWRWQGRQRLGMTESFGGALAARVRQAESKVMAEQGSIRGLERMVLRRAIGACLRYDYDISNKRELEAMENMLVRMLTETVPTGSWARMQDREER